MSRYNAINLIRVTTIFMVFFLYLLIFVVKNYYASQFLINNTWYFKTSDNIFWKFVNAFAFISFEFYLFHSLILSKISKYISGSNSLIKYLKIIIFSIVYNRPDQTRPDQTRPDHELICIDYICFYNNSKYKKIQPMLQYKIAA